MKKNTLLSLLISLSIQQITIAGSIPLTNNDDLSTAINSNNALLDVLSNDSSGISNDDYKEVIAVCGVGTSDFECTNNSFNDGIGVVTVNGTGNSNNVLFNSNHNQTHTFSFKYVMQNSDNVQGSGIASVSLGFFEVNSLSDGSVNGCDASQCTLRAAINAAASDNEPSLISFERGMVGTITLNSGLNINSNDLTLSGPGANKIAVSGNNLYRVLTIPSGTERFKLSGLTLSDGQTPLLGNGGGLLIEGALETRLENIRVINNTADNNGGGIYAENAGLTLVNSEISQNNAGNKGGGISISGGFGSDVTIENSTISSNGAVVLFSSGIDINTTFGQTTTLRFITVAFNSTNNGIDSNIEGDGNIIIDASVFEPGLKISNANNVTNNSIFQNLSGSVFGQNNRGETGAILNPNLTEVNNSGLFGHKMDTDSLAYNHIDDLVGNANCGTEINGDQFGTPRPQDGACDAGAYEYIFIDEIFADGFE